MDDGEPGGRAAAGWGTWWLRTRAVGVLGGVALGDGLLRRRGPHGRVGEGLRLLVAHGWSGRSQDAMEGGCSRRRSGPQARRVQSTGSRVTMAGLRSRSCPGARGGNWRWTRDWGTAREMEAAGGRSRGRLPSGLVVAEGVRGGREVWRRV